MFKSLLRATVRIVTLPIDIVKDIVPRGEAFDNKKSATSTKLKDIEDNIKNATKPKKN